MNDMERSICRYYNTLYGCWFGEKCKFLHISNKKPPCKFFSSATGCRFGESCHFSHDRTLFKSLENYDEGPNSGDRKEDFKENLDPSELSCTNNNNMAPSMLAINSNNANSACDMAINEGDIQCGTCKRVLERQPNESYCNLLKNHYLDCFLEKEGDHIKTVKAKAALDPGQMYWCKTCILIFEKPWSLFQHMADKARGSKVQRWDKKIHMDWLETIAGLLAGFDLSLFSPGKVRSDLRNLLADQHTMEEEMEAAAITAAALMQLFNPAGGQQTNPMNLMQQISTMNALSGQSNPMNNPQGNNSQWRLQQREMMRKLEQINRQAYRKQNNNVHQSGMGIMPGASSIMPGNGAPYRHSSGGPMGRSSYQRRSEPIEQGPDGSFHNNHCHMTPKSLSQGDLKHFNDNNAGESHYTTMTTGAGDSADQKANSKTKMDLNCGFTEEEVRQLETQGIKPWDEEAHTALQALRGELDYLLEK